MLPIEVITKKRNKISLTPEEIELIINGFTTGKIPDYQMSAFLMAGYLNGFSSEETYALTNSMIRSGRTVDFSDCDFPTVDKHSTGGVGDKTSIILGPLVAACEVGVPMIAGRGLGHTGGTVDKLEAIPGFSCDINLENFKKQIQEMRLCLMAQTNEICPADKKIYALRDVTATIESIPLICASIMSKKLAEGIASLVLDVKYGNGAFMRTFEDARRLGLKLQEIGKSAGRNVSVFITSMEQPLGEWVGNATEIKECVSILKGDPSEKNTKGFYDTKDLSLTLSAEMLLLSGKVSSFDEGLKLATKTLESGKAYEKFKEICKVQGGNLEALPEPTKYLEVKADAEGYVESFDTKGVGIAGILLKAGRQVASDRINPVSGIRVHKGLGDKVQRGDVLWTLVSDETTHFDSAQERLKTCIKISEEKTTAPVLIADHF